MNEMKRTPFSKVDALALAAILLVAAIFRLYHLTDIPAGILPDTAINGIDAWRLAQRPALEPFLFANGGREALFIYLQALAVSALGTTNLAVRLPGVLVDFGTVALVFAFTRWLTRTRWAAIFAGFSAATSFWLIPVSRLGFRAILVPLVSVVAVWLFLWAWQRNRWADYLLAGIAFGVGGYTYLAAKILPLVVGAVLPEMIFSKKYRTLRRWGRLGLLAAMAASVYLPIWLATQSLSGTVSDRVSSLWVWHTATTPVAQMAAVWRNLLLSAGYFCCTGNPALLIFGSLNRAAFGWGLGAIFFAALGWAVTRSADVRWRTVWLWWVIGIVPGVLAIEAPHPLRLIAAAVPSFVLLGVGMAWLARRVRWGGWLALGWLAIVAGMGFVDFYGRWAVQPAVAETFFAASARTAEDWLARTHMGETLDVPQPALAGYGNAPLRFYLLGELPPRADGVGQRGMARLGNGEMQILSPADAAAVPLDAPIPPLRLVSAAYPFVIPPKGELPVTLFWQTDKPLAEDYLIVLQLLDDARQVWSVDDAAMPTGGAYPPRLWRAKTDTVPDVWTLHLKDDLPSGRYQLAVAVYDPRTGNRLLLGDGSGDTLFLRPLKVPLVTDFPATYQPVAAHFAGVGALVGYQLPATELRAGEPLSVTLLWRADATPSTDYTVFVHILDNTGNMVGGQDNQPVNNRYPTTIWSAGEEIVDPYIIPTDKLPSGEYRLSVGMYEPQSGTRVAVDGAENGEVLLPARVVIGK